MKSLRQSDYERLRRWTGNEGHMSMRRQHIQTILQNTMQLKSLLQSDYRNTLPCEGNTGKVTFYNRVLADTLMPNLTRTKYTDWNAIKVLKQLRSSLIPSKTEHVSSTST